MRFLKVLLPVLVFGILALMPHQASAATATFFGPIIPAECHCENTAPDFGCVLQVIENLMNFAISIGVIIFVLVAAYAGLLWMFSPMNAHNREQGRTILLNAVVGLLITLCAWLIVDFVMKTLYNEGSYGPWNAILQDGNECLVAITPPQGSTPTDGGLTTGAGTGPNDDKDADGKPNSTDDDDDNDLVKDQVDNCPFVANQDQADADNDGKGDACETPAGGSSNWQTEFSFDSGIRNQISHASAPLSSVLSCMAERLPANIGRISSISDNRIVNGTSWATCRAGQCTHCGVTGSNQCTPSIPGDASYHYGGATCGDHSYAADFGDGGSDSPSTDQLIKEAARACGGRPDTESNHTHVEVGSCN